MLAASQRDDVLRVAQRMLNASIGETVRYKELSSAANLDIQQNRWLIMKAIKLLNKEYGIVFATVRGEGYRRLGGATGAEHVGSRSLLRVRRTAQAGIQTLENAIHHANDMSFDQQRAANSRLCALGLIHHLSLARTVKTLPGDHPPSKTDGLDELHRVLTG